MATTFETLNGVNVNDKTKPKGNLTYLSWAYAWGEVKKKFPEANYTIYKNEQGWNYHTDGRTCWVECSVTINGLEHLEHLAIMDARNQSVKLENVTSTMVVKTIQRCITKACARHGLALYIYAGEDLPDDEKPKEPKPDTISFGSASRAETKPSDEVLPFDIGGDVEPLELIELKAKMLTDDISEEQVLDAFKGKYSAIENIEPKVIKEMLLDKWGSFVKFIKKEK